MRRFTTLIALFLLVFVASAPAGAVQRHLPKQSASFNDEVRKVAYHGDILFAGGKFSHALDTGGVYRRRDHIAAVNSVSGELLDFRPRLDGPVLDLSVGGGYLYAAGDFRRVDGHFLPKVARFDLETLQLDTTFAPKPTATVFAVEPVGDLVYLGGRFTSLGGGQQSTLAAVRASDATLVTEFAPDVRDGAVRDIEYAHGRLYISGAFNSVEGYRDTGKLAAVNARDGRADYTFRPGIRVLIRQIATDHDRVYAALDGRGGEVGAFDKRGRNLWYVGTDGGVQAVAVVGQTIIGGGHFDVVCNSIRSGPNGECVDGVKAKRGKLVATDRSGKVLDWNPDANSIIGVWDLEVHPQGKNLAAAGAFTTFGGGQVQQRGLAIFD
jgi:hypothetical protein